MVGAGCVEAALWPLNVLAQDAEKGAGAHPAGLRAPAAPVGDSRSMMGAGDDESAFDSKAEALRAWDSGPTLFEARQEHAWVDADLLTAASKAAGLLAALCTSHAGTAACLEAGALPLLLGSLRRLETFWQFEPSYAGECVTGVLSTHAPFTADVTKQHKMEGLRFCMHAVQALGPLCRAAPTLDWLTLGRVALRCRQLADKHARLAGPLAPRDGGTLRAAARPPSRRVLERRSTPPAR